MFQSQFSKMNYFCLYRFVFGINTDDRDKAPIMTGYCSPTSPYPPCAGTSIDSFMKASVKPNVKAHQALLQVT